MVNLVSRCRATDFLKEVTAKEMPPNKGGRLATSVLVEVVVFAVQMVLVLPWSIAG